VAVTRGGTTNGLPRKVNGPGELRTEVKSRPSAVEELVPVPTGDLRI
jgi:hypothetical protein